MLCYFKIFSKKYFSWTVMRPRCVSGNVCKQTSMCYQPGGEIMASLLAVVTIVLINGCFHNGPVMCPRSVIMARSSVFISSLFRFYNRVNNKRIGNFSLKYISFAFLNYQLIYFLNFWWTDIWLSIKKEKSDSLQL
jgi:hypothetical protein